MTETCARCRAVRSSAHLTRLHEVVAYRGPEARPVYVESTWAGAPWVCQARTSCRARAKAQRSAA